MRYEPSASMRECLAYAMVRAPKFNPEDGRTTDYVLNELRTALDSMRNEWWGGNDLYRRMSELLDQAVLALQRDEAIEAKRAWGEVYAIIDQTPRPSRANTPL